MRTDLQNLEDGVRIKIFPKENNPITKLVRTGVYGGGYVYLDGSDPTEGPDYYWRDFLEYNEGFTVEDDEDE